MYYHQRTLGFSLKPPKWARNFIRGVTGQVATAGGTVIARDTTGAVTVSPPSQAPQAGNVVSDAVGQIPGGWMTVVGGVALLLLLPKLLKGRR